MAANERLGKAVFCIALFVYFYYLFWVSVLPFMLIDKDNFIRSFFPPLEYAFIAPAVFGMMFLGGVTVYALYQLWTCYQQKIL